jgi:integrase
VLKLTSAVAKSLTLPPGQLDKTFFDSEVAAFGVRVRAAGSRNWVVQYKVGGKNRRLVLGAVTALDASKARSMAKDVIAAIRLGKDPVADRLDAHAHARETFGLLLARFLARQRTRMKPRSFQETERHLTVQCRLLHARPLVHIDRRAIAVRLGELAESSGPTAANRCRASLSAYFAWLAREGIVEANPVQYTNRAQEVGARTRFLSDDELAKVWRALGDDEYSRVVKLLTLTGARREEIGALRWSEVDLDRALVTLSPARTKSRRQFQIPLSSAALDLLKAQPRRTLADGTGRDFVFGPGNHGWQAWVNSKRDLDARCGVAGWVLHDLRRTLSTVAHERLGVLPHIVEALLSHVSGYKRGAAGTYNQAAYLDERRRVLERWSDHIAALVGEKPAGKVVKLR